MTYGVSLIAAERDTQIKVYHYTGKNQALNVLSYGDGQLLDVAKALTDNTNARFNVKPANWDIEWLTNIMNKPYTERLAIAGSLIAAELDRLKYLEDKDTSCHTQFAKLECNLEALTDDSIMLVGMHAGKAMSDVPDSYLRWLFSEYRKNIDSGKPLPEKSKAIHNYIVDNYDVIFK